VVHTIIIPAHSRYIVKPALLEQLGTVEEFAQHYQAKAAPQTRIYAVLNGGFFDPENRQSTSYVTLAGKRVADPRQNQRLMQNPNLVPYLDRILNRTELRRYTCGQTSQYEIVRHQEPPPTGCILVDALGGGPRLLPELTDVSEGFLDRSNGVVIRDPLGSDQPNARSAIGITQDSSLIWMMVAQKPEAPLASGMSLPEVATLMKTLGAVKAMNLDGGSSASLYYQGKVFYGKVDTAGQPVKRSIKSVLLIQGPK
jgi:hypothetical protein